VLCLGVILRSGVSPRSQCEAAFFMMLSKPDSPSPRITPPSKEETTVFRYSRLPDEVAGSLSPWISPLSGSYFSPNLDMILPTRVEWTFELFLGQTPSLRIPFQFF